MPFNKKFIDVYKWTQSLIITLPKIGNLHLCQNYRTISLLSHPSKVMLKVILKRLKPHTEKFTAEEQAGFRAGRSAIEQIFNVRILMTSISTRTLSHVHSLTSRKPLTEFGTKLIQLIKNLHNKTNSAVFFNNNIWEWFRTTAARLSNIPISSSQQI